MVRWQSSVPSQALADVIRASHRLGSDPSLVLHGGGNTSIKTTATDLTGRNLDVLLVKGSGQDLGHVTPDGFAPLRLDELRRLLPPVVVPDDALLNELRCALIDSSAPDPSVETLVHALLPQTVVLHSHADAILTLSDSADGPARLRELAPDCVFVEYAMPGPALVAACAAAWRASDGRAAGLIVLGHGLFTVGDTADEALARHLDIVARAQHTLDTLPSPRPRPPLPAADPAALASLRRRWCETAGQALVVRRAADEQVRDFVGDPRLLDASQAGPLTPDHVSWTKRTPMIGTDLGTYAREYERYVSGNRERHPGDLIPIDPAPRVALDPQLGLLAAGNTSGQAAAVEEIYRHTMTAIERAGALGGYRPAGPGHVFDLEYWAFQQEKMRRRASGAPLSGQVALVTGAASGIGRGCAQALLDAGAAVVGWDLSPAVTGTFDSAAYLGLQLDVTDPEAVAAALARQVEAFGGLDILVVAAGIFPSSANLGELTLAEWRRTMAVNTDAVMELYGQAHPLLAAGYPYGRVVLIASKNVAAPGPGAAAYSSSKAAVTQLTRVAALEWAGEGIRVNMLHPDAVFDTGLWTPELLRARAEHYGMSVDDYKRRNLLHTEITSARVGRLALALCTEPFASTTGAQIPIDGGNERVI